MIVDKCKDNEQFKKFYEQYATSDIADYSWLISNKEYTYCFFDDNEKELLGCIYLDADKEKRTCLNGFSKPKQMDKVIEAIKYISNFFHKDTLYAHTKHKHATLVLLKSGFKKFSNNLLIRKAF